MITELLDSISLYFRRFFGWQDQVEKVMFFFLLTVQSIDNQLYNSPDEPRQ